MEGEIVPVQTRKTMTYLVICGICLESYNGEKNLGFQLAGK